MFAVPIRCRTLPAHTSSRRLRRQAGATLIEQALVLMVIAGLIGGSMMAWNMVQSSTKDNNNLRDTGLLMSKVRGVFDGQSSYGTGSLNATLLTYGAVPASMINGSALANPWGGTVTVTGAGATYTIASTNIPQESCATMAKTFGGPTGGGSGITGISVNGSAVTLPMTPASAASACNAAINTVTLTLS